MKIITHDKIFHADEIFAIALLRLVFGNKEIVRTREITIDDMTDPSVWVIDVGAIYSEEHHNFDHHQDKTLESSNVLVLEYLYKEGLIVQEFYERLLPSFKAISLIDRNGYEGFTADDIFHVNSLIKSMNSLKINAFETAVKVAYNYIESVDIFVSNLSSWKSSYDNGKVVHDIAIAYADIFPVNWKEHAKLPFLMEASDGNFKLHTSDSKKFPIQATGTETFIHVNRFIAVYPTLLDLLDSVKLQQITYEQQAIDFEKQVQN